MQKYWFQNITDALKIQPSLQHRAGAPMNEEIRNATELAKDPSSYSAATYVWVLILSMWGGLVRIVREIKLGQKTWEEIAAIVACELIVSIFAGVLTFYLCDASNFKPLYTAVMTATAGYMGGRSLAVFEAIYKSRNGGKGN